MAERLNRYRRAYERVGSPVYLIVLVVFAFTRNVNQAPDMHAYWNAAHSADPYAISTAYQAGAYLYSPAFLQVLSPLTALSWPAFGAIFTLICGLALYAVAREWSALALLFLPVTAELNDCNIDLLLACVLVWGFRRPSLWAFALLTKPTLGLCLLWFAARREWTKLAEAIVATAAIAAVSALLAPAEWGGWIAVLLRHGGSSGGSIVFVAKLALGGILAVVAARRDQPVLLPVAALLAWPEFEPISFSILIACLPLYRARRATAPAAASQPVPVGANA